MKNNLTSLKIAVIGLGYVGLPLANLLSRKYSTVAFDSNKKRITELKNFKDINKEVNIKDLKKSKKLK